jgi:GTP pyrophosphokinase
MTFAHETGALAKVCSVIAEHGADITQLEFTERKPDFYRARFDLEVRDVKHVSRLVTALNAQPMVHEARRLMPARDPEAARGAARARLAADTGPETAEPELPAAGAGGS